MEFALINLSALRKRMKEKPIGQRLWFFIKYKEDNLKKSQLEDMIEILESEHKNNINFIKKQMKKCTA